MALARTSHLNEVQLASPNTAINENFTAFTPPANSLLVFAFGVIWENDASDDTFTVTSNQGLTWTKREESTKDQLGGITVFGKTEVWTAPVGASPASTTITVSGVFNDDTHGLGDARVRAQCVAYTGYNVSDPIGATIDGEELATGYESPVTITLSASPASTSYVFACRHTVPNAGAVCRAVPGSGWSEIYDFQDLVGTGDFQSMDRTSSTSASVTWDEFNDRASGDTDGQWESSACAIEIKAEPEEEWPPPGSPAGPQLRQVRSNLRW